MAKHETLNEARKDRGASMPGGRYPIRNESDAENAERAIGRTAPSGRPAVERHIETREKELGIPTARNPRAEKGDTSVAKANGHAVHAEFAQSAERDDLKFSGCH